MQVKVLLDTTHINFIYFIYTTFIQRSIQKPMCSNSSMLRARKIIIIISKLSQLNLVVVDK